MSAHPETASSTRDTALLWLAVILLAASITGFYWFEGQFNVLIRVIGMFAVGGLALLVALQSQPGRSAWVVVRESRTEVRKVVWPTRKETAQTTAIILIVVLIIGIVLWGMDSLLLLGLQALTGRGG